MAGLVPTLHVVSGEGRSVNARDEPGHDGAKAVRNNS
jgi:hypothetical protein